MWSFLGDQSTERQWKTCGCCHVRTATAILGMWHLFLHVIALGILAVVLMHPEKLEMGSDRMSMPDYLNSQKYTYEDLNVGLIITFVTLCITVILLYGTVRAKPSYLLPFFCLQMFDLFVTCLAVLGYLSYVPDVRHIIAQTRSVPFRDWLLSLDTEWLTIVVLVFVSLTLIVKAYFLWIVWSCYKYLCWRQSGMRNLESARDGVMIRVGETVHDPDYLKLPLAMKIGPETEPLTTSVPDPPPPYTATNDENLPTRA